MKALSILVVALAGCAAVPQVSLEERMQQASNMEVCEAFHYAQGYPAQLAGGEASRRGVDCQVYLNAIVQQRQARAAAAAAIYRPIVTPPLTYTPIQPPRQINCNSYRIGNTVQTNCN